MGLFDILFVAVGIAGLAALVYAAYLGIIVNRKLGGIVGRASTLMVFSILFSIAVSALYVMRFTILGGATNPPLSLSIEFSAAASAICVVLAFKALGSITEIVAERKASKKR